MNRQILDEASVWFVDFRVGDVDGAARSAFDEWLRASPEHVRAYMQIAKTYVELPSMTDRKFDPETLIAYARGQSEAQENVVPFSGGSGSHRLTAHEGGVIPGSTSIFASRRVRVGLAAAVCLIGGLLAWLLARQEGMYATDIGERRSITLSDGSTLDLNARSKVRVRFSQAERDVELIDGQALFQVARDPARPFVVRTGGGEVRAVGTQFDVYRKSSGTTVTVLEGRVAVSAALHEGTPELDEPAAIVSAGEQVTVTAQAVSTPKHTNIAAATAWMQRWLVFDGSRLGDVVEDFNRYSRRRLIVDGAALQNLRISGVYSSTDPTSLVRFLREQPDIRVIEAADSIRIVPAASQ